MIIYDGLHDYSLLCSSKYYKMFCTRLLCVENISKLLKEININNIHELFYIYCYLLWNGYFSIDKSYVYNSKDILDEYNTIFLGRGCCRHNTKLLREVFENLGIKAPNIGIKTINLNFESLMPIEIKFEISNQNLNILKKGYNHSINIIKENNCLFILDPTNNIECEVIKKGKLISFDGQYKIRQKLLLKELHKFISSNYQFNEEATLSKNDLLDYYNIAQNICDENRKLFDDFFYENRHNYEKIKKLLIKQ